MVLYTDSREGAVLLICGSRPMSSMTRGGPYHSLAELTLQFNVIKTEESAIHKGRSHYDIQIGHGKCMYYDELPKRSVLRFCKLVNLLA